MYEFTNNWFRSTSRDVWRRALDQYRPSSILEIGSYEGASACYLIEELGSKRDLNIKCIDTWQGGIEHDSESMEDVYRRFMNNTNKAIENASHTITLTTHKQRSDFALSKLITLGYNDTFDMIYVDGSHEPQDVIVDCVLAFRLLKKGGLMIMDDYYYLHKEHRIDCSPKFAIDSFVNLYFDRLTVVHQYTNADQFFIEKQG